MKKSPIKEQVVVDEMDEDANQIASELLQRGKIRETLKHTIENMETLQNDLTDLNKKKFQVMNEHLNETFEQISHPRELTLDAVGMKILSTSLKSQALKLSDLSKQHNFETLALRLKELFGVSEEGGRSSGRRASGAEDYIDWSTFGLEVQPILATPVPLTTMVGPFQKEERIRKAPVRRKENEEDNKNVGPEKPKEVQQNGEEELNEATNVRVQNLLTKVRDLTYRRNSNKRKRSQEDDDEASGDEVGFDLLELLVDPVDDVQTIENFFDFSFLIKEKAVIQALDKNDLPIAISTDAIDQQQRKQMVLTITTKDLKQLRDLLYGPQASKIKHPLHRDDEIYKQPPTNAPVSTGPPPPAFSSPTSHKNNTSSRGKENSRNIVEIEEDYSSQQGRRKIAKTK
eukprot:gene1507-1596_t